MQQPYFNLNYCILQFIISFTAQKSFLKGVGSQTHCGQYNNFYIFPYFSLTFSFYLSVKSRCKGYFQYFTEFSRFQSKFPDFTMFQEKFLAISLTLQGQFPWLFQVILLWNRTASCKFQYRIETSGFHQNSMTLLMILSSLTFRGFAGQSQKGHGDSEIFKSKRQPEIYIHE